MRSVAVLVPSYKPGAYVEACFESLERQTLSKGAYKVYVALNGPREEYEDYLFRLLGSFSFASEFFYIESAGVSRARNFLLENSSEDYVVFVDDDDRVSDDYLEELLEASDADVIGISNIYCFDCTINELRENYIGRSFLRLPNFEKSKFSSRKYFSSPCAKMIHRKMIGKLKFDTSLAIGEDSLFMAQISKHVAGVRKTNASACYYVNERQGSVTRAKRSKVSELRRFFYLSGKYIAMMLSFRYDFLFIATRLTATARHLLVTLGGR